MMYTGMETISLEGHRYEGHLWPEGIYVRWYRPAEKMLNKDARNAEPRNGSATSVNL